MIKYILFSLVLGFFLLLLFSCGTKEKFVKGLYGFSRNMQPFKNKTNEEIADFLSDLGVGAVWGGYGDTSLVKALHNKGVKVFGTAGIFIGENYWNQHPESRPITSEGLPIEKDEWYAGVCPTQDWLREQKLREIEKMVTENPIDGVWLDFIRYPCHWEVLKPRIEETCFNKSCLEKFQQDTGTSLPTDLIETKDKAQWILSNHLEEWTKWKCQQITSFVGEVRKVVKKHNPKGMVGLFGVPWRRSDYDDAILRVIGQDYAELAAVVDVISPMSYHLMCGKPVEWIGEVTEEIVRLSRKPVWPTIQAGSTPSELSEEEFLQALQEGMGHGASGVIVFTLNDVIKENKWDGLVKAFSK